MTFEPVPMMFFNKHLQNHRINSLNQKKIQLKKLKLDFLIIIKFNKKFSSLTANEFIKKIIFKKTKCKYLYVSKNFKFGFKRKGNINTLKKFEKTFGYKNIITKPYKINNKIISSTFIRKTIKAGKINLVNKLLNRYWSIEGKVIEGNKRGRMIGFPTCNSKLKNYIVPKLGVYAVNIKTSSFSKNGIANIGYRPTFNGQSLLLETNIFGINKNLYNKVISVYFKKFIRPEKKFKNFEHLKKQIKLDIKEAKKK
jgi:riboflavin kinase/FMN adenylyltransferase